MQFNLNKAAAKIRLPAYKRIVITFSIVCILSAFTTKGSATELPPAQPCDIVYMVAHFIIPRIHYEKSTSLEEGLEFNKYKFADIDERETTFTFEYRLSKETLHRLVTLDAKNITMLEAIKRLLGDSPVVLSFEPGKLVFTETSGTK